jgi:hypothetical protein
VPTTAIIVKSQPGPPMTLGNAAAARVWLIVWCKGYPHRGEPEPAEMAARDGAETPVLGTDPEFYEEFSNEKRQVMNFSHTDGLVFPHICFRINLDITQDCPSIQRPS